MKSKMTSSLYISPSVSEGIVLIRKLKLLAIPAFNSNQNTDIAIWTTKRLLTLHYSSNVYCMFIYTFLIAIAF